MGAAGSDRVGPTGDKRTFHSLRHTFARIAIEHNRPIFWLSKHLGHSSLSVTSNVYGHFEKATRKREAEAMAGVFGVYGDSAFPRCGAPSGCLGLRRHFRLGKKPPWNRLTPEQETIDSAGVPGTFFVGRWRSANP
jgi:Phage integrase family